MADCNATPPPAIFDPHACTWVLPAWRNRFTIASAPDVSRFYQEPIVGGPCCLWSGWSNGKGHGIIRLKGARIYLHRYAYMQLHSCDLLPSQAVDHLCRRRPCFNPYHLECVSHEENYLRGDGPDYQFKPKEQAASENDIAGLLEESRWRT